MDQTTHGREILDLIFSNNEDLVSSVSVEAWPAFTDHSVVSAVVSYKLEKEQDLEESHLLESGRRLKKLNFNKAPWPEIQAELRIVDWSPMVELADQGPVAAHEWFIEKLLPLLEKHVPVRGPKKKGRNKLCRRRNLLWRKLSKIQRRIQSTSSISRLRKLIQDKWNLEVQLKSEYVSCNRKDEEKAMLNIKDNPKSFFSYAKSRQKTRARIGPFIDPSTGQTNSNPDFAAKLLSDQFKSVFVKPRTDWLVDNVKDFFSSENEVSDALSDIQFCESDIELACQELNSSSAPGPDGLPASLLKT